MFEYLIAPVVRLTVIENNTPATVAIEFLKLKSRDFRYAPVGLSVRILEYSEYKWILLDYYAH